MIDDEDKSDRNTELVPISARDLSRVIRRIAHLFATGPLGNLATADALAHLSDHLDHLGQVPVERLRVGRHKPKRTRILPTNDRLRDLPLAEVERMIDDENLTKADLSHLAKQRFGMPEAQLKRLPIAAVRDEVKSAVSHERSLEFIERNAELSGKSRRS